MMWRALTGLFLLWSLTSAEGQCPDKTEVWSRLEGIFNREDAGANVRELIALRRQYEACRLPRDSVYARLLHLLGRNYWDLNQLPRAVWFTRAALPFNQPGRPASQPANLVNSHYNLGRLYDELNNAPLAVFHLANAGRLAQAYPGKWNFGAQAYQILAQVCYRVGDYQRSHESAEQGVLLARRLKDPYLIAANLILDAQATLALADLPQAEKLLRSALEFAVQSPPLTDDALAYAKLAELLVEKKRFAEAVSPLRHSLDLNLRANYGYGCAQAANDLGFLHARHLHQYAQALDYYRIALKYVTTSAEQARTLDNIGAVYQAQKRYQPALVYYQKALLTLPIGFRDAILAHNPASSQLRSALSKEYLLEILQNKASCYLRWGEANGTPAYFKTALQTYAVADHMVDYMRWEHTGEGSKKFWREKTHRLYEAAIETCHHLNQPEQAFYFFEKSRAALLADRLNELGASQLLNAADQKQEADLQTAVVTLRQSLSQAKPNDKNQQAIQQKLLEKENEQTSFVRRLETQNPAYFRYRYDTTSLTLPEVRQKLLTHGQTLLEYFTGDSASYALKITPTEAKLVQLDAPDFARDAHQLLTLSADAGTMNRQFPLFLQRANDLFRRIFAPLDVPKGRVIVSPDGAIVPLDLLSRSATRPAYLLTDYAFSYTYSARFLVKQAQRTSVASKSFLGLAPVDFASGQPTLRGSDASLKTLADGFFSPTLLVGPAATKRVFLREIPRHRVVQLYAHAQADSTGAEPLIYFADSTLRASELSTAGLLPTQLVVLSACQTGVGQATRGEGVFSLARSLAAAGVPATVTTLWRVDNRATYRLTELFFEKLKEGLPKDEALQQAKLAYLKSATGTQKLPPFWAGMVLVGEAAPLENGLPLWVWAGGGLGIVLLGLVGWRLKKSPRLRAFALSP